MIDDTKSRNNFCAMPFGHMAVDTMGNYAVCCVHGAPKEHQINIREHGPDTWLASDYLKSVQDAFLQNQQHPGCSVCWTVEKSGFESIRTRSAHEYKILQVNPEKPKIVNVELQLGNLCNLTCVMCHELDSSAILAENRQLGINKIEQKDINWTEQSWQNLQKILDKSPKILNFRGGEPLYNKSLLNVLQNIPVERKRSMMVHITTNATVWNDQWADTLSQFKLVRIMASIDAVESVYEYIRFPAHWKQVESNVKQIQKLSNVRLTIATMVQNLNILHLKGLISWCQTNNLHLTFNKLINPRYLKITNLPSQAKDQAIQNLEHILDMSLPNHLRKWITSCLKELSVDKFDKNLWNEFQTQMLMRERLRGNDHRLILPY